MSHRILGIIGGMGPEATADLMLRVVNATPAKDDQDHIRMLVDNNPKVSSRINALVDGSGESPAPALISMARGLAKELQLLITIYDSAQVLAEAIVAEATAEKIDEN